MSDKKQGSSGQKGKPAGEQKGRPSTGSDGKRSKEFSESESGKKIRVENVRKSKND